MGPNLGQIQCCYLFLHLKTKRTASAVRFYTNVRPPRAPAEPRQPGPGGEGGALLQSVDGTGNVTRRAKWLLLSSMGTLPHVPAPSRTAAALLMIAALAAACGSSSNKVAGHSPSPSASPSQPATPSPSSSAPPQPVTGAYGVLYSSQAASTYTVSIVGVDGKVVASAEANTPTMPTCANAASALVNPPVSASNSRVYFLDSSGAIRYLGPGGDTGQATSVPAPTASRRAMFAVSPDDARIAVIVDDFNSSGASTRLYVENLYGGGSHLDLFSESGAFSLWPVGWHGTNNLVLGKIAACTQGGGPFVGTPTELHVVDPASAVRRFTIGGSNCYPVNRPSPAGVICENPPTASELSWTDSTIHTFTIQGPVGAYLSPSGSLVAFVDNVGTTFSAGGSAVPGMFACAWIDDSHVLSGGDAQHQPRVTTVTTSAMVAVAAQGDCAGRLPGGL